MINTKTKLFYSLLSFVFILLISLSYYIFYYPGSFISYFAVSDKDQYSQLHDITFKNIPLFRLNPYDSLCIENESNRIIHPFSKKSSSRIKRSITLSNRQLVPQFNIYYNNNGESTPIFYKLSLDKTRLTLKISQGNSFCKNMWVGLKVLNTENVQIVSDNIVVIALNNGCSVILKPAESSFVSDGEVSFNTQWNVLFWKIPKQNINLTLIGTSICTIN